MTTDLRAIDERLIKVIAHPLRQRILQRLSEGVASPSGLAEEFGEPLNTVSYHVKVLEKHGAIELAETRQVRSVIEHFYRANRRPVIDEEHWSRLPLATRRLFMDHLIQQLWEHVVEADEKHSFDDPSSHVSWTRLTLDHQGYEELNEALVQLVDRAMALEAECAVRIAANTEADDHKTELAILHYHRDPSAPAGGA
jgi:DNA-binding transcriptional ArsR family regulator